MMMNVTCDVDVEIIYIGQVNDDDDDDDGGGEAAAAAGDDDDVNCE